MIPTVDDLATRRPISLTNRDLDILTAIYQHGFLTRELIELAFFPASPNGRHSDSTGAYERLRQLWLWRFVERVERPVARKVGGAEPYLYAIGRRAVPWVAQKLFTPPGRRDQAVTHRRLDKLNPQFVDHDLYVARLWANVAALLRGAPVRTWRWEGERSLRARNLRVRDPKLEWPLPFLPDGYFEIIYGTPAVTCANPHPSAAPAVVEPGDAASENGAADEIQCCLVEMDMGRLTLARFRRKVRAFELALDSGLFRREWGRDEFEVLVLVPTEERLVNLMRAASVEVPADRRGAYAFAAVDVLDPARFGDPVWTTLEDERIGLLYEWDDPLAAPDAQAVRAPEELAGRVGATPGPGHPA